MPTDRVVKQCAVGIFLVKTTAMHPLAFHSSEIRSNQHPFLLDIPNCRRSPFVRILRQRSPLPGLPIRDYRLPVVSHERLPRYLHTKRKNAVTVTFQG